MKKFLPFLFCSLLSCHSADNVSSTPAPLPLPSATETSTTTPAMTRGQKTQMFSGNGWSVELPDTFIKQSLADDGMTAVDHINGLSVSVNAIHYEGSFNELVWSKIKAGRKSGYFFSRLEKLDWAKQVAGYAEAEKNDAKLFYWITLVNKTAYMLGCSGAKRDFTHASMVCHSIADSFVIRTE